MKMLNILLFLSLFAAGAVMAVSNEEQQIKTLIQKFSDAGDNQDSESLEAILDGNYRIVMNQLFGSTEITLMDRQTYLQMIKNKEFGGDKRKVKIESISIVGNNAIAIVDFIGEKMTMHSILVFVKDNKSNWKLISDVPSV
jgi:uncharacterized membrane protein YqiK